MAYGFQVTVDTADPHPLADWWAEALGWQVEQSDEAFIRSLLADGLVTEADTTEHRGRLVFRDGAAILHPDGPAGGAGTRILFQRVPEPKTGKNRLHLDIRVGADNVEAVVAKLVAAGATVLHHGRQGPHAWVTIADPEGNELCIS